MILLIRLVDTLFSILSWLIIIRVILSWLRPQNITQTWMKVLNFIYKTTEPILGPIRDLLPLQSFGIDFSPLIALLALSIIQNFVMKLLYSLAF